ncbi:uncharacterized protein UHOD_11804 [Ustilago sp. UG-2017b]|nr:uncharacterized protein UHOD_11804 [Ustilago sp. UG-2017b]
MSAPSDTAPPPQDLLAGLLYTAPPPSTGDGSFDSCLSSPWVVTVCMLLELGPHCGGAWTSLHMDLVLCVHGLHGDCTPTMPTTERFRDLEGQVNLDDNELVIDLFRGSLTHSLQEKFKRNPPKKRWEWYREVEEIDRQRMLLQQSSDRHLSRTGPTVGNDDEGEIERRGRGDYQTSEGVDERVD